MSKTQADVERFGVWIFYPMSLAVLASPKVAPPRLCMGLLAFTVATQTLLERDRQVDMRRSLRDFLKTPTPPKIACAADFDDLTLFDAMFPDHETLWKIKAHDEKYVGGTILSQRLDMCYNSQAIAIKSLMVGFSLGLLPFFLRTAYWGGHSLAKLFVAPSEEKKEEIRFLGCLNIWTFSEHMLNTLVCPRATINLQNYWIFENMHFCVANFQMDHGTEDDEWKDRPKTALAEWRACRDCWYGRQGKIPIWCLFDVEEEKRGSK